MNSEKPNKKRAYQSPKLRHYGRLEDITRGSCPGTSDADTTSAQGSGKGAQQCGS